MLFGFPHVSSLKGCLPNFFLIVFELTLSNAYRVFRDSCYLSFLVPL
ncbi:unnamed protein product [Ixodes persulcatus]